MSIARTWSGATRAADADAYLEYLRRTGLRAYARTPGNEGIVCLRRVDGERAEFTIVSLWRDREAVEAFAGSEPERAVFYPDDEAFLIARDERVRHYEVSFSTVRPERMGRLIAWWASRAAAAVPAPRTRESRHVAIGSPD